TSEFYDRLQRSTVMPATSQPSPATFAAAYQALLDGGADVISLHISAALSGTFNAANIARAQLDPARIAIVDTRQASFGAQTLVREAVRSAGEGSSLAEVAAGVEALIPSVRIVATVDTLEYLRRNGRIGRVSALLGGMIALKVLITVSDGIVVPLDKVRTRARSLQRVQHLIEADAPFYGPVLVGHTHDPVAGEALVAALQTRFPEQEVLLCEVGPAIGAHAGPGTVGAGYILAPR
ncbi:MAG TPA: DegV family protein, partial [Chloroflexota bacterium]|nr:DegV family protein [Chloroflexota bacterium]